MRKKINYCHILWVFWGAKSAKRAQRRKRTKKSGSGRKSWGDCMGSSLKRCVRARILGSGRTLYN
jgi:hypothetical protein